MELTLGVEGKDGRRRTKKETIRTDHMTDQSPEVPSYHIMPDLSKGIGKFNEELETSRARQWFESFDFMKNLHQWPDSFALEAAKMHVTDGTRD